jgi:hypothetical protein
LLGHLIVSPITNAKWSFDYILFFVLGILWMVLQETSDYFKRKAIHHIFKEDLCWCLTQTWVSEWCLVFWLTALSSLFFFRLVLLVLWVKSKRLFNVFFFNIFKASYLWQEQLLFTLGIVDPFQSFQIGNKLQHLFLPYTVHHLWRNCNALLMNVKTFFCFFSSGVWTQSLVLVKQVLYHLSHAPSPH